MPRPIPEALRDRLVDAAAACATAAALLSLAGCGRSTPAPAVVAPLPAPAASQSASPPTFTVAFLGDSLTAGLGLAPDEAYPAVIGRRLQADGYREVVILNAGISGDTTAGGLSRVDALLTPDVRILVVALGGNDLLRGLSPTETRNNLTAIVGRAMSHDVAVLLAGLRAPTNLGPDYDAAFVDAFGSIARTEADAPHFAFVPFLLEDVAGVPSLNQSDGIHPTAEGDRLVANHLYPTLRRLVDAVKRPAAPRDR